jgi:hypothetical protein
MRSRQRLERNADKTIGITPMALDAEAKTLLAKKAANVSAEKRREKTKERDEDICLAFRYLSGEDVGITGRSKAFKILLDLKHGVKLPDGKKPTRFLADATGLTPQRIEQIVKKGTKLIPLA